MPTEKQRQQTRDWFASHPNYAKDYGKSKYIKLKAKIISHYTNGSNKCLCCGESRTEFLSLFYRSKSHGAALYFYLVRNNYPQGPKVLCYNCNFAKIRNGTCPHEKEAKEHVENIWKNSLGVEFREHSV